MIMLLSRVCAFYEEEGHAIMDCPFVFFHIRARITRHVELQNVVGSSTRTGIRNSYNPKQI
jgi:hypothetical protein